MLIVQAIGATPYSFTDRESGRLVEGVNLFHLVRANDNKSVGQIPQKVTLPYGTWGTISQLPFPIEVELITTQELGKKGIVNKVTGVKQTAKKF